MGHGDAAHPGVVLAQEGAQVVAQQGQYEAPAELQNAKIVAEIEKLLSEARKSDATTAKTEMETSLAPMQAAHQVSMDRDNFRQGVQDRAADRKLAARKPQAA